MDIHLSFTSGQPLSDLTHRNRLLGKLLNRGWIAAIEYVEHLKYKRSL